MQVEFIVWGIPPQGEHETPLVEGIASADKARAICAKLEAEHGCTKTRVARFVWGDGSEVAGMFRRSVRRV